MKKIVLTAFLLGCFAGTSFLQDTTKAEQEKQKPRATYQVGAAKVTVWENEGKYGTWKNFQVEKVYKKGDEWLTTNSFDEKELLQLKAAIDKAISEELVKQAMQQKGKK
jgi:hypothetical protein